MRGARRVAVGAAMAVAAGGTMWIAGGSATADGPGGPAAVAVQADTTGSMETSAMAPGAIVWVEADGFAAGAQVEMYMDGGLLATAAADQVGRVRFEWELAAQTSIGTHQVKLQGTGVGGALSTLTSPVAVGAAAGSQASSAEAVPTTPRVSG